METIFYAHWHVIQFRLTIVNKVFLSNKVENSVSYPDPDNNNLFDKIMIKQQGKL